MADGSKAAAAVPVRALASPGAPAARAATAQPADPPQITPPAGTTEADGADPTGRGRVRTRDPVRIAPPADAATPADALETVLDAHVQASENAAGPPVVSVLPTDPDAPAPAVVTFAPVAAAMRAQEQ